MTPCKYSTWTTPYSYHPWKEEISQSAVAIITTNTHHTETASTYHNPHVWPHLKHPKKKEERTQMTKNTKIIDSIGKEITWHLDKAEALIFKTIVKKYTEDTAFLDAHQGLYPHKQNKGNKGLYQHYY